MDDMGILGNMPEDDQLSYLDEFSKIIQKWFWVVYEALDLGKLVESFLSFLTVALLTNGLKRKFVSGSEG